MAEGLLRHDAGDRFEVASAGVEPTQVRPLAIRAMNEIGIDISGHRSKSVDEFEGQNFDYIITVCDNANQQCPMFPGNTQRIHWSIADPAAAVGSAEEQLEVFQRVRDELRESLGSLRPSNDATRVSLFREIVGFNCSPHLQLEKIREKELSLGG